MLGAALRSQGLKYLTLGTEISKLSSVPKSLPASGEFVPALRGRDVAAGAGQEGGEKKPLFMARELKALMSAS